jgi:hypothetical protein
MCAVTGAMVCCVGLGRSKVACSRSVGASKRAESRSSRRYMVTGGAANNGARRGFWEFHMLLQSRQSLHSRMSISLWFNGSKAQDESLLSRAEGPVSCQNCTQPLGRGSQKCSGKKRKQAEDRMSCMQGR